MMPLGWAGAWAGLAMVLAGMSTANAQIGLQMKLNRQTFVPGEAIMATLTFTNLAGVDVTLENRQQESWLDFRISDMNSRIIGRVRPGMGFSPLSIPQGGTAEQVINLTPLYYIRDPGVYRIIATVQFPGIRNSFESRPVVATIQDGRRIWSQTVGVPDAGGYRQFTLLSQRKEDEYTWLFARVDDASSGGILAVHPIGHLLNFEEPQVQIDGYNRLHILSLAGPKMYFKTVIGTEGEFHEQETFERTVGRPSLVRLVTGEVQVAGAALVTPVDPSQTPASAPRLSDLPPGAPAAP